MTAGRMREAVSFRRVARTQRDDGGYDTSDSEVVEVDAEVKPVQANEREQAGRLFGSTTYMITVYADDAPTDLTIDDSVRWTTAPNGAVDMNIRAIRAPDNRARFLEIVAEARAVL